MQRKRGDLVPIGEVIGGLDGPVQALRAASPQALHHYSRFDQVNQLVSASEADADLGFMARTSPRRKVSRRASKRGSAQKIDPAGALTPGAGGGPAKRTSNDGHSHEQQGS